MSDQDFTKLQIINIQSEIFTLDTAGMMDIAVWDPKTPAFICNKTIE